MVDPVRGGTEVNTQIRAGKPSISVPKLTAVAGPGIGRAIAMSNAMATAGRHPSNDLVLNDPLVSGVHLELRRIGERVHLRDAASTNGTWFGPHRISEVE